MVLKRHLAHLAILSLSLASIRAFAAEVEVHVLNYAPLTAEFAGDIAPTAEKTLATTGQRRKTAQSGVMRFNVFGKTYTATLQANSNIDLPQQSSAEAYKGTIDGKVNSWLRVTRIGTQLHGLVFDGTELFAIEPAESIGADPSLGSTIFRLADTKTDIGAQFCDALKTSGETSGLEMFKSLSGESKTMLSRLQKLGARTRLQMSALMDLAYRARFSSDAAALDAIVARVNNIDGIFSTQLGIEVELDSTSMPETSGARVFNSTLPDTLLQSVARIRSETPALYTTGITHLFTGTDLEGKTIGIAYMDSVCGQRYGASLSEVRDRGAWFDSLVAAHELGHTFGSPHDSEGECAATPTTFLMSPAINGNERFSQCSLNKIQARMQTASCLIPIPLSDASVPASLAEYHAPINADFSWTLPIANIGNAEAQDVQVQLTMPTALIVNTVQVSGGSCSVGGGAVTCRLGVLPAQSTRNIEMSLKGTISGDHAIVASVSSVADANAGNNALTAAIRIDPSVDISVALAAPATASVGQAFDATFTVANKGASSVQSVTVEFSLPSGLSVIGSPQFDGIACQRSFAVLRCSTTELTAGRSVSSTLSLLATEPGAQVLTAALDGSFNDPTPTDNSAQKSIAVSGAAIAAASSTPSDQGSGGGSMGSALLATLSALGLLKRRRTIPNY